MNSTKHRFYNLAYRAHLGLSFSPKKRAQMYCDDLDQSLKTLKEKGASEAQLNKYESLWLSYITKKGRCMSPMITGPANFPAHRNSKKLDAADRALNELCDYYKRTIQKLDKERYYEENPHARPVMAGDENALERLQEKLTAALKAQETMKAVNRALRNNDDIALAHHLGCKRKALEMKPPDCMGDIGFASYALNNNRAEIKRLQARIADITRRKDQGQQEVMIGGVKVVQNAEAMRLQILFDGKPDSDTIKLLKSRAFKWSPKAGAWQRQLTNNALYAYKHDILPHLKTLEKCS